MKTMLKGLFLSSVLVALTGCGGVTGTWTMDSIEPESAKSAFPIATLCLHEDHTYAAHMECGSTIAGNWEYDADTKMLAFTSPKGKERTYKASLCRTSGKLIVQSTEQDEDWKAAMKRAKCEPEKCGSKKCDPKKCPSKKKGASPKPKGDERA